MMPALPVTVPLDSESVPPWRVRNPPVSTLSVRVIANGEVTLFAAGHAPGIF